MLTIGSRGVPVVHRDPEPLHTELRDPVQPLPANHERLLRSQSYHHIQLMIAYDPIYPYSCHPIPYQIPYPQKCITTPCSKAFTLLILPFMNPQVELFLIFRLPYSTQQFPIYYSHHNSNINRLSIPPPMNLYFC